jgi:Tol biopolymer transport system component/predicted Ser/Thr protein kinase
MSGETISHYQLTRLIGSGGMGVVHLARDTRLGRLVALKLLQEDVAADPDRHRRLEREARAASSLNHPNIVTVYDVGEDQGRPFIAMEYVEGQTLADRLAGGSLPLRDVVHYARQIASALAAAHGAGIVHRDLKPANVLLTPDRRAKVADFGLAKLLPSAVLRSGDDDDTRRTAAATQSGVFVGTTSYVSPEQAEGRPVDARSDIFSFGSVLYEMVTGRRAFGGSNPMSVLAAVIGKDPTPLSELVGDVPQELQRIVTRCLRKDPDRRFQNMSDVCVALDELGDELSEGLRARARSGPGWRAALLMVAGVALVAVVAAVWWTSQRPQVTASRQQLVSTFAGSHRAASFSPDGRMIAFVSDADGSPQVWVKNLSGGDPIQITRGVPARRPRWSPLNDQIVFERVGDGIWSVPPLGGEPRRITDGYGPNISADGRQIVFERSRQIWIAAADGTGARKIEGVPLRVFEQVRAEPALSPDGRTIAYFLPSAGPNGDLWTIPAAGGQPLRLTNDNREAGGPVWTRDSEFILFWSSRTGARTLWRVPARGGTPEPITTGTGEDSEVDLAADGRIIFTNVRNDWIMTVTDPKDGSRRNLLERRTAIWLPKLSPDGQSIAFFADVEADTHVFVVSTSGGTPRQITFGEHQRNIHPIWSPDGRYLYYYSETPSAAFRRIPFAGGDSIEIASGWRWPTHINTAIDPSGTLAAYHRQVPGQTETTLVRELSTGRETVISEPGAKHLHSLGWSLDGQSILGWRHGDAIVICPAAGGPCRDVGRGTSPLWSRDRSRIYFRRPTASPAIVEVWSFRTDGTDERKLAEIGPMHPLGVSFDVTADGKVLWTEFREGRQELWIAETAGTRRK